MTTFIPNIARFSARSGAARRRAQAARERGFGAAPARLNIEYLAGLIPVIRRRLGIAATFSDAAIFASLTAIAGRASDEQRWRAAEASTLGLFLLSHGRDFRTEMITLLGLLPKALH